MVCLPGIHRMLFPSVFSFRGLGIVVKSREYYNFVGVMQPIRSCFRNKQQQPTVPTWLITLQDRLTGYIMCHSNIIACTVSIIIIL